MRLTKATLLIGGVVLLASGAAMVATSKYRTMNVAMPDGSVAHIQYVGDVAPKIEVQPAQSGGIAFVDPVAFVGFPAFADMARMSAAMESQQQAMMRQIAQMEHVAASAKPGQVLVSGKMPAGSSFQYTVVSSTNGNATCTRTTEWRSDGSNARPKVTQTSAGDCDAVQQGEGSKPVPASAPGAAGPAPLKTT